MKAGRARVAVVCVSARLAARTRTEYKNLATCPVNSARLSVCNGGSCYGLNKLNCIYFKREWNWVQVRWPCTESV